MSEDPMRFSIDEHDLEVIRFQKHPIQPIYVKSIDFHAGYRYDVVVTGKSGVAPGAVRWLFRVSSDFIVFLYLIWFVSANGNTCGLDVWSCGKMQQFLL